MKIVTRVWLDEIEAECTVCDLCEQNLPFVFKVSGEKMRVIYNGDVSAFSDSIVDIAESCPVAVIAYELDNSGKRDNQY